MAPIWHHGDRIAESVTSQTAVDELDYSGSVLWHVKRKKLIQDVSGPAIACKRIAEEGMRTASRTRERRITDAEIDAVLEGCDQVTPHIPLGAIVSFALATSMRWGEILRLRWDDLTEADRVILIRNRKHPRDKGRIDDVALMPMHGHAGMRSRSSRRSETHDRLPIPRRHVFRPLRACMPGRRWERRFTCCGMNR